MCDAIVSKNPEGRWKSRAELSREIGSVEVRGLMGVHDFGVDTYIRPELKLDAIS